MEFIRRVRTGALLIALVAGIFFAPLSNPALIAHPVWGEQIVLQQPDGTFIRGFVYGDEFYVRIETEEGFTVLRNEETGEIEYAVLVGNRLRPSGLVVGRTPPSALRKLSIPMRLSDRKHRIAEERIRNPGMFHDLKSRSPGLPVGISAVTGTNKVFVVCVQFQPEENPPTKWSTGLYSPQNFSTRLFSDDPSQVSMTNFYKAQSYGQFWPTGDAFPTWVTVPHPASYYKDQAGWRTLLVHAIDAVRYEDPDFDFTQHADNGEMDVILIWAGTMEDWGAFFWPHMRGVGLEKYNVTVRNLNAVNERNTDGSENSRIDIFCHEYGHMTGLPDLYDYSDFFNRPLGYYCLMGIADIRIGFCAYIKSTEYGWVEAQSISGPGTYDIDALGLSSTAHPKIYRIELHYQYPPEYLLLENRSNGSHPDYENFPYRRNGLLITHVDELYPPAAGLPSYQFYGVEAICPALDPSIDSLQSYLGYWDEMVWSSDYGYTQLGSDYPDDKPPGSYLTLTGDGDTENVIYRNTRGHRWDTNIHISDISSAGNTMTFSIGMASFTLTISAGAGGTTDPPPGIYTHPESSQVKVQAVEDRFYSFAEWKGDLPLSSDKESKSVVLFMDADRSVSASFKKIHPPLDFKGEKVLNRSLSQSETINILTWKSNPLNEDIQLNMYRLYQYIDGEWNPIYVFDTNSFEFAHRFLEDGVIYSYALVAVDFRGQEGVPSYVVVH